MVVDNRFPPELTDFAFLEPNNFGACDAEIRVRKLAFRYNMFTTCRQADRSERNV